MIILAELSSLLIAGTCYTSGALRMHDAILYYLYDAPVL
jgi:hypothetical protein